jgi:Zn finger protein HypA/HybF involved in hydrogenase expression
MKRGKTMKKMTYTCPHCGGSDVQQFIAFWVDANTHKTVNEYGLAELYPAVYWCEDCQEHPDELIEQEVEV